MPIVRYGATFPDPGAGQDPSASIELKMAFDKSLWKASGFLSKYQHLHNAIELIWNAPKRRLAAERRMAYDERKHDVFIWNDWSETMIEAFCEGHWSTTVWSGNSSWKTTCVAMYGLCAFYASPPDTVVVMTTTTLKGLKQRLWKEVLKFHRLANSGIGNVNASDYAIRFQKGSDESGLFGFATGQNDGDVNKAVDKIIGFHAKHTMAIVDEAQATNEAVVKGCLSLEAGADSFQLIAPGNPDSELDTLGKLSEPVDGYESITPEFDRWKTKRGICIRFDGLESPRILAGEEFYPGMLTKGDIQSAITQWGEDSPEFWRTRRGFIAPQGITKTVLSPSIIAKFHAKDPAVWVSDFVCGAGLDPAFEGGDRCMLRFGKCGQMIDGKTGIELGEMVQIKTEASSKEPTEYQIVRQVRDLCEQHDPPVPPELFALDATGTGRGIARIFHREWSPAITFVEFGGRASDMPVSEHNQTPCHQAYLYRVTELWYTFKTMVQNGQIRGLDQATALEFCQRFYQMRGNLIMLESKADMKARTRKSPDLADCTVVLTELFRQTCHLGSTGETVTQTDDAWEKYVRANSSVDESEYLIEV